MSGFRNAAEAACPRIPLWKCLEKIPVPQLQHQHPPQQPGPVPASADMLIHQRLHRRWLEIATLERPRFQQHLQELILNLFRIHSTSGN